jgi:hypothetical protein
MLRHGLAYDVCQKNPTITVKSRGGKSTSRVILDQRFLSSPLLQQFLTEKIISGHPNRSKSGRQRNGMTR